MSLTLLLYIRIRTLSLTTPLSVPASICTKVGDININSKEVDCADVGVDNIEDDIDTVSKIDESDNMDTKTTIEEDAVVIAKWEVIVEVITLY